MSSAVVRTSKPSGPRRPAAKDTTIATYRARRDFTVTAEPPPSEVASPDPGTGGRGPIFVVQKHDATRLHWDFRLEHDGVMWSWAVPRGPSLDPKDKRLAVHVEDHPIEYATFHGTIPEGQYGAGTVETWDRGTWAPVGDPDAGLAKGDLKFVLKGKRLNGRFVLVRMKPRPNERTENWLLIKEHDDKERAGVDAATLETEIPPPKPAGPKRVYGDAARASSARKKAPAPPKRAEAKGAEPDEPRLRAIAADPGQPPASGAQRAALPDSQAPQLATLIEQPPDPAMPWLSEVKFDGYRFLAFVEAERVRMVTRNGLDWTHRVPAVAEAVAKLGLGTALLDGEVVALRPDGVSSFADLKAALSDGKSAKLSFYVFDLLHLDGWDLRSCALRDRKRLLAGAVRWSNAVRYSDHHEGDAERMHGQACGLGLEGIICKRADAPYRAGRGRDWVKLKCQGREEFIVVGWTPPQGSRSGLGALHMGFRDADGRLHYVGGVGTGFTDAELTRLRKRLDALAAPRPEELLLSGDPIDKSVRWVRPELVAEVQYLTWTGAGRLRHAVYLGLREDKRADDVVRAIPDPEAPRRTLGAPARSRIVSAAPAVPKSKPAAPAPRRDKPTPAKAVVARAPSRDGAEIVAGVRLTHPDRELWPGITKRDLAAYWEAVSDHALPEIGGRPLALVRCPEGFAGEHFFQKHAKPGFPHEIRAGESDGAPWLAIDGLPGLVAAAQVAAIELHAWGAAGRDPLHPDRLVFDLDPGEGIAMADLAVAARDVRDRLARVGLASFCRTSGGKGLHVVAPIKPTTDWDTTRAWCRAFAERMEAESGEHYVASVSKAKRRGRILVDWLRNGLGSTAVATFSPRAREGAGVAFPIDWTNVTAKLDPRRFDLRSVPGLLARRKRDPWEGFAAAAKPLPAAQGDR